MSWLSDWMDDILMKRVVGLIARRLIDFVAGALLTVSCFGTDICSSFSTWITTNATELEVFLVATVLGLVSMVWSLSQKKGDVKEIRRQASLVRFERNKRLG